jgi:Coenzyme PQQ synthesis protein D (PqqD)
MSFAANAAIVAANEQISWNLSGDAVILNLRTGIYFGLNPVGARVWELLQQPRTVSEIRDLLLSEYEVDSERCEQDLYALVEELASRGLIQTHGAMG